MDYTVKTDDKWNTIIALSIAKNEFEKEYTKVLNLYRKQAKIDGFRPGKAPLNLVEKKFSSEIEEEAINRIIPEQYEEIAKKEGIRAINRPAITDLKRNDDSIDISISVDIMPEITLKDYESIDIDIEKNEINEDMINNEIERIRKNYAKMDEKEGELDKGNVGIIDLKVIDESGNEIEKLAVNDYSVEIGTETIYKEISEALVGKTKDDACDAVYTYPDDFNNEDLKGKTVTFKMNVKKVFNRILPELNDDFAKNFGMNNMEQVKTAIKNNLSTEFERDYKLRKEEAMFNFIIEKNPFNVPVSLINAHLHSIIENTGQKNDKEIDEKILEVYKPYAEWRAKRELILNTIIKQEKIIVSDEEISKELEKIKKSANPDIRKYADEPDAKDNINTNLLYDKAMELLDGRIKGQKSEVNKSDKQGEENASNSNGS